MTIAVTGDRVAVSTRALGDRFYARMAAACFAIGVIGFAPTYWLPLLGGTLNVAPLAHVHAVFFYGWLLLFVRQSSLAAAGQYVRHRAAVAAASGKSDGR